MLSFNTKSMLPIKTLNMSWVTDRRKCWTGKELTTMGWRASRPQFGGRFLPHYLFNNLVLLRWIYVSVFPILKIYGMGSVIKYIIFGLCNVIKIIYEASYHCNKFFSRIIVAALCCTIKDLSAYFISSPNFVKKWTKKKVLKISN